VRPAAEGEDAAPLRALGAAPLSIPGSSACPNVGGLPPVARVGGQSILLTGQTEGTACGEPVSRCPPIKGAYAAPLLRGLLCPRGACADLSALLPISPGRSELASVALDGCRALAVGPGNWRLGGASGSAVRPTGRRGSSRPKVARRASTLAGAVSARDVRASRVAGAAGELACRPLQARRARSRRRRPGPGVAGPGVCIQPCSCMQLKRLSAARRGVDSL
jgi:hypothetical protein